MFYSLRDEVGPFMTQCAALRFASALPDISCSGQDKRTEPDSDFDHNQVAHIFMAGRDSSSSVCIAIALPLHMYLLSQANREIYHPLPDRVALWARPMRGQKLKLIRAPTSCCCYHVEC